MMMSSPPSTFIWLSARCFHIDLGPKNLTSSGGRSPRRRSDCGAICSYSSSSPSPFSAMESATIKVVRVGGGENNAINHMIGSGLQGVELYAINTGADALMNSAVENPFQIGGAHEARDVEVSILDQVTRRWSTGDGARGGDEKEDIRTCSDEQC